VSFLQNVQTNLAPVSAITEKCSVFTVRSLLKLVGQDTRQNCRQSEKLSGSSSPSSPQSNSTKSFTYRNRQIIKRNIHYKQYFKSRLGISNGALCGLVSLHSAGLYTAFQETQNVSHK